MLPPAGITPVGITPAMEPEPELALPAAVQPQHPSQPEPQIAQIAQAASVPAQPAANHQQQQQQQQQHVASMVATCNIGEAEARFLLHQAGWDLPLAADRFMQTQAPAQPPQLELKPQTQAQLSDMAAQAKGAVLRIDGAGTAEVNGYYKQDGEFRAANRCFATLIRGWLLPCHRPAHAGTHNSRPKYTKIDNQKMRICARHTPLIRASRALCCTVALVCCLCGGLSCD
jgi:hypothetical protein